MTKATLKKEIHQAIDSIEDNEILKVVHVILKRSAEEDSDSMLTDVQKAELDKTLADHKAGKLKYYTLEQSKKLIYGKAKK